MKTVLLVDDDRSFLESAAAALQEHRHEFEVIDAQGTSQAVAQFSAYSVDLLVTGLRSPERRAELLAYVTQSHPSVPIIVFAEADEDDPRGPAAVRENGEVGARSASHVPAFTQLRKPVTPPQLRRAVRDALAGMVRGKVEGISLFGLLQVLGMERRTCALDVHGAGQRGLLHLVGGELVHAEVNGATALPAVYTILSWPMVVVGLAHTNHQPPHTIDESLSYVLFEAARRHDEHVRETPPSSLSQIPPPEPSRLMGGSMKSRVVSEDSDGAGTPIQRLVALCHQAATGEFIVATVTVETHVHLQNGRIVWAVSSGARGAFLRHLTTTGGIDVEEVRQVVIECQQTQRPIIETLVQWNLASVDQVRGAVLAQAREAIGTIDTLLTATPALFLRREINAQRDISFAFAEVCEVDRVAPSFTTSSLGLRSPWSRQIVAPTVPTHADDYLLPALAWARLLAEADAGVDWLCVVRGKIQSTLLAEKGVASPGRALQGLSDHLQTVRATMVTLRSESRVLLGLRLPTADATLWCGLAEARHGLVAAALPTWVVADVPAAPEPLFAVSTAEDTSSPPQVGVPSVAGLMGHPNEFYGLFAYQSSPGTCASVGHVPADTSLAQRSACAEELNRFFSLGASAFAHEPSEPPLVLLAYTSLWVFGCALPSPATTAWLAFDRTLPQGVGWAFLKTLPHQVSALFPELSLGNK